MSSQDIALKSPTPSPALIPITFCRRLIFSFLPDWVKLMMVTPETTSAAPEITSGPTSSANTIPPNMMECRAAVAKKGADLFAPNIPALMNERVRPIPKFRIPAADR